MILTFCIPWGGGGGGGGDGTAKLPVEVVITARCRMQGIDVTPRSKRALDRERQLRSTLLQFQLGVIIFVFDDLEAEGQKLPYALL